MLISYLMQGAGLGLSASATPGSFQAFLIARAVQDGWRRTLPATLAPLLSDGPIIALVLLALTQLPPDFLRLVRLGGGLYVIFLAWKTAQACRRAAPGQEGSASGKRSLLQAVGINLLNPNPYLFWSLAAGPAVIKGWAIDPALAAAFMVGFYLVFVLSSMLVVILFSTTRALGPKAIRGMLGISAAAMLVFGIYQLIQGLLP